MKKVIIPGKVIVLETTCNKCSCKFSYESEDIENDLNFQYVTCPECHNCIMLSRSISNTDIIYAGESNLQRIKEGFKNESPSDTIQG